MVTEEGTAYARRQSAKQAAKAQVRERMQRAGLWEEFVRQRTTFKKENRDQPEWLGWHVAALMLWDDLEAWEREHAEYGGDNPLQDLGPEHYPSNHAKAKGVEGEKAKPASGTDVVSAEAESLEDAARLVDGKITFETLEWVVKRLGEAVKPQDAPTKAHYSLWLVGIQSKIKFVELYYKEKAKQESNVTNFDDDGRETLGRVETLLDNITPGQKHAQETREQFKLAEGLNDRRDQAAGAEVDGVGDG